LAVAAYNGEGYTSRELNRGKTLEGTALVSPVSGLPLALLVSYQAGSSGTARARADRVTGGVLLSDESLRAGVTGTYAWGVEDDGARRGYVASAFARVTFLGRFYALAEAALFRRSTQTSDRVVTLSGGLGARVAPPLEAFVVVDRSSPSGAATSALPSVDFLQVRAVTRLNF
jgi:hypothetical protein